MKYRGVIFDLDGVICHTDGYHYKAWKMIADELGIYFDEAINDRLRGVSRMESLEIILEGYHGVLSREEKERCAQEKNKRYRELLNQMSPADLEAEVKATLFKLRQRGHLLAIGSSSKNASFILKRLGLEGWFDGVADGNGITRSKPDPEVFLLAAKMIGVSPFDCLVVEDAVAGVKAAKAGGMAAAGIGALMRGGVENDDQAERFMADYILADFSELLEVLS